MAKNRVRLEISGVSCALFTEEDEAYVKGMAKEVETLLDSMTQAGSSFPVAAVITALSYLDESNKNRRKLAELEEKLKARENDLRFAASEYKRLKEENTALEGRIILLRDELKNAAAENSHEDKKGKEYISVGELKNPFRRHWDDEGLVSFYEKK